MITLEPLDFNRNINTHILEIVDNGGSLGEIEVRDYGQKLEIIDISVEEGPHSLGSRKLREIQTELKRLFPDARIIQGLRLTGMRLGKGQFVEGFL